MAEEPERITLPKDLQVEMLKFFLRTSIPRKMKADRQKAQNPLSEISDKGEDET